jgi:hypothetical protein
MLLTPDNAAAIVRGYGGAEGPAVRVYGFTQVRPAA